MKRNGFTITEAAVALAILGVAITVGLQLATTLATTNAKFQRRQLATEELQNQIQYLETLEWDQLDDQAAKSLKLSDAAKKQLHAVELSVAVHKEEKTDEFPEAKKIEVKRIEAKRITVSLTWQDAGEQTKTMRLSTWRFRKPEPKKSNDEK